MSAFPSVQQIDPLSPSAVQNTMGIAANNNATAERASRERQSNAALKQDSAEKAKYQTFLAGQQTQQLEAQSREAELNRQAEERHAQRQEDLMREMKALELDLDNADRESDAELDEKAAQQFAADERAKRERLTTLQSELNARQAVLDATKNGLTKINKQLKTGVDTYVAEKTNLIKNLAAGAGTSVGNFILRYNTDEKLRDSVSPTTGVVGLTDRVLNAARNPIATIRKNPTNPLGPVLTGTEAPTDEVRAERILTEIGKEMGTNISSIVGTDDAAGKALTTMLAGVSTFSRAATPEAKEAARQTIAQSVQALKQASNGTLDDYTIHEMMRSAADAMEQRAIDLASKKGGDNVSEVDKTVGDAAKGMKGASAMLRSALNVITKPSAREASDPSNHLKSLAIAERYMDVMRDPTLMDAKVKEAVDFLQSKGLLDDIDAQLNKYRTTEKELLPAQKEIGTLSDELNSGSFGGTTARAAVRSTEKKRSSARKEITDKFRNGGKKKEE